MLAEIAAANAAFAVLKQALANGKEMYDVADSASKYFDSKAKIAQKAKAGGNKTELECFLQLEKIKEQENWLKEHMIYAGRPDMYDDWLKFQAECKRKRTAAAAKARRERFENRKLIEQVVIYSLSGIAILPVALFIGLKGFGVM